MVIIRGEQQQQRRGLEKKCSSRGDSHRGYRSSVGVVSVAQRESLRWWIDLNDGDGGRSKKPKTRGEQKWAKTMGVVSVALVFHYKKKKLLWFIIIFIFYAFVCLSQKQMKKQKFFFPIVFVRCLRLMSFSCSWAVPWRGNTGKVSAFASWWAW